MTMTPNQTCFHLSQARRLLPHGIRPTDLHVRIGQLLANWNGKPPTQQRLADAAGCHVNTVKKALNRMRDLDMLGWSSQYIRGRQIANRYRFNASFDPCAVAVPIKKAKVITNTSWSSKIVPLYHPPLRTVAEQIEFALRC